MWLNSLYVAIGGAIGAVARLWLVLLVETHTAFDFPLGIFVANMLGSFLMGMLSVWLYRHIPFAPQLRYLVLVGMLGAFTTFSTFSYDLLRLVEMGKDALALLNAVVSVFLGVVCAMAGLLIARSIG